MRRSRIQRGATQGTGTELNRGPCGALNPMTLHQYFITLNHENALSLPLSYWFMYLPCQTKTGMRKSVGLTSAIFTMLMPFIWLFIECISSRNPSPNLLVIFVFALLYCLIAGRNYFRKITVTDHEIIISYILRPFRTPESFLLSDINSVEIKRAWGGTTTLILSVHNKEIKLSAWLTKSGEDRLKKIIERAGLPVIIYY